LLVMLFVDPKNINGTLNYFAKGMMDDVRGYLLEQVDEKVIKECIQWKQD